MRSPSGKHNMPEEMWLMKAVPKRLPFGWDSPLCPPVPAMGGLPAAEDPLRFLPGSAWNRVGAKWVCVDH